MRFQESRDYLDPEAAPKIRFYAAVLGLNIPQIKPGFEMSNIFPESHIAHSQAEIQSMEQSFTFRSLLLNQQIELVRMRTRLAGIEQRLDTKNLSSLLINPETTQLDLEKEKIELSKKLVEMPPTMPKHIFKAIWEEQLRRMEVLQITPTQGQKNMSEPLPILGFDPPSTVKLVLDNASVNLPFLINWYNIRVDISNTTRVELELKRKITELKELSREEPLTPEKQGNTIHSDLKELEEAKKNYEEWKTSSKKTRGWGIPITLEFRSKLIQLAETFPFVKLTRDQILGIEPWPRIDIAKVPRPPDEKLIPELELLDAKGRMYFFNKWPDHWKANLSDDLKKLIKPE